MDRFTLLTLQSIMGLGNFVFGDLYRRYVCFHEIFPVVYISLSYAAVCLFSFSVHALCGSILAQ